MTVADRVAVLLVNSLELPVAYFALMKLGAVFVPLDPAWPREGVPRGWPARWWGGRRYRGTPCGPIASRPPGSQILARDR